MKVPEPWERDADYFSIEREKRREWARQREIDNEAMKKMGPTTWKDLVVAWGCGLFAVIMLLGMFGWIIAFPALLLAIAFLYQGRGSRGYWGWWPGSW